MRNLNTLALLAALTTSQGVLSAQAPCGLGSAVRFDGMDDRIMVPYNSSFPTAVFTACAWIEPNSSTSRGAIIARGEDDNSYDLSWALYVANNGTFEVMLEDSVGAGTNQIVSSGINVVNGGWRHVAATRSLAGVLTLYVDGVLAIAQPGTVVPSSDNFHDLSIGCSFGMIGPPPSGQPEPPTWFFSGEVDEVAMWDRELSAVEIALVIAEGADPASANLKGYWKLDEGAGQSVSDLSPAGNHGYFGATVGAVDSADPLWVEQISGAVGVYCVSAPNSAGSGALMAAMGSTSIQANDFTLTVSGAVPNTTGLLFYGPDQQQTPFGDGWLCIGPGLTRLNPPLTTDGGGQAQRHVDFTAPPAGAGATQLIPGTTWNFQYWYRDVAAGGSGFNVSNALEVVFCN